MIQQRFEKICREVLLTLLSLVPLLSLIPLSSAIVGNYFPNNEQLSRFQRGFESSDDANFRSEIEGHEFIKRNQYLKKMK